MKVLLIILSIVVYFGIRKIVYILEAINANN